MKVFTMFLSAFVLSCLLSCQNRSTDQENTDDDGYSDSLMTDSADQDSLLYPVPDTAGIVPVP